MLYQNVELHNIEEVTAIPGSDGVRLQRVPERVRVELNEKAQERMLAPACSEIRFVCDGPAKVTLSSLETTQAVVFYGAFQIKEGVTIGREPKTITLDLPERLGQVDWSQQPAMPFSPNVYRLMFWGGPLVFHSVEGESIRPPQPDELPKLRYLSYGTSITHGAAATGPHLTYVGQTTRRLGADLINLGVGGSAYCEFALADYIASRDDWHIASLALSVNMIGGGFSLDEFYERVSYMVNTVAGSNTGRPVACITIYPHFRDMNAAAAAAGKGTPDEYRQKLRDALAACPHPNAHLIEGPHILTDIAGLTPDLIHPADNGMIEMGERLAQRLQALTT